VIGDWGKVSGFWFVVSGLFNFSPITNHQSPITNHQSPITNHQSPITNHQSPITNHQFVNKEIPLNSPDSNEKPTAHTKNFFSQVICEDLQWMAGMK
jgi:hypothetical protein